MSSSQTKFDDKIMIYIEFCIRKRILNLGGVPYFQGAVPPKSQFLAGLTPNAQKEGHSARPVGGIFKNPYVLLQFCVLATFRQGEMTPPPNTRGAPCKKPKKVPFLPNSGRFSAKAVGHRRFWEEAQFLPRNLIVQRRTTIVSERFGKNVRRAEIWGRF